MFIDTIQQWLLRLRFLGGFVKLRTASISFVMRVCSYVRLSVRPHGITRLPLDEFSCHLMVCYSSKIRRDDSSLIKIGQE